MNCSGCGGVVTEGPPTNLPGWFTCPPPSTKKRYAAPEGVELLPITQGGRGGPPEKSKCEQCGKKKRPTDIEPAINPECPMAKIGRTPGLGGSCFNEEGLTLQSAIKKVKDYFGIGKPKPQSCA